VSTESGIPDFRSQTGLYAAQTVFGRPPEELLSRTCFEREPALFFRYYINNLITLHAAPNAAHQTLARLEARGLLQAVITQNIDGLHQRAGSRNVIELHGANSRQYCADCHETYTLDYILDEAHRKDEVIPVCGKCGGIVRPDVVLYGESLDDEVIGNAIRALASADLLIVGGTSLVVYPAAGLLRYFGGAYMALINKAETAYDGHAQLVIHEAIGKVFGEVGQIIVPQ